MPICVCKTNRKMASFSMEFAKKFSQYAQKYDIVLIHGLWMFPASFAAFFCKRKKIPYIIFTHAMMSRWSLSRKKISKKIYFQLIEKNNLDKANAILVMDNEEAKVIEKKGIKARKICFQNALNKEEVILMKQGRDARKQNPSSPVFLLYLSRIHPKKGLIFLIEAIRGLRPDIKIKVKLIIAGPPEDIQYFKKVKKGIKKYNLEKHVDIIGMVYAEKKKRIFEKADIFILPSADDSKPLALLEAMACGVPVITTASCKMPEINNKMGYVVKREPKGIARAITQLVENRNRANEMGENAHRYVLDNFTWDKATTKLLTIIEEIVNKKKT